MIRKILAPDFKVTQEKKLSHLSGTLIWLIFYPTGAKPLHHRHILTLNNKASSVAGLSLKIVCVFRSCPKQEIQNLNLSSDLISVVEDREGAVFDSYNGLSSEEKTLAQKLRTFIRGAFGIKIKKRSMPLHCLVAEDGVVEQVFRGENFSDHLGWDQVKKFIEFRKLGHWPNAV